MSNIKWNLKKNNYNKIKQIFPILYNGLYNKILIDKDSFNYISYKDVSEKITNIICSHLISIGINPHNVKLADYNSGVGGNVISFSNIFKEIVALEICVIRASYLVNNLNLYNIKNVKVINGCSINYNNINVVEFSPNVIFLDVPWGDNWNKTLKNYKIIFGIYELENFIINIYEKIKNMKNNILPFNSYNNRIIVLKLPKNYDIDYLYQKTKNYNNLTHNIVINLHILEKMLIVVYELIYINEYNNK